MGNKDNYSRNQCSLLIRINDEELEIPVNFGLTPQEIKAIYPYLAKLANSKIKNPALAFSKRVRTGDYTDLSDKEYMDVLENIRKQSEYWYQKPEASLLDIAIRLALDIKFKGIQEIQDAFATVTPFDHVQVSTTVSSEEADAILKDAGMETESPEESVPDDENDIEAGTAGSVPVDFYGEGYAGEFLSKELDAMDSERAEDHFEKVISDTANDILPERYKSSYKAGEFSKDQIGEDGLLDIYATSGSSDAIFGDAPDDGSTASELLSETSAIEDETDDDMLDDIDVPEDADDVEPEFEDNNDNPED